MCSAGRCAGKQTFSDPLRFRGLPLSDFGALSLQRLMVRKWCRPLMPSLHCTADWLLLSGHREPLSRALLVGRPLSWARTALASSMHLCSWLPFIMRRASRCPTVCAPLSPTWLGRQPLILCGAFWPPAGSCARQPRPPPLSTSGASPGAASPLARQSSALTGCLGEPDRGLHCGVLHARINYGSWQRLDQWCAQRHIMRGMPLMINERMHHLCVQAGCPPAQAQGGLREAFIRRLCPRRHPC